MRALQDQSCTHTASITNGKVIYGVIWTPSYRRVRCFLTMYAVIYVFYRSIRTVLQNVMTASVVMCTSLFRMCAPEMLCSGCALFRRCALLRCAAQSCAVQGALLRMCAGCSISAPLCLCPAVTSQCMHNSLRTFDRVSHNAAAGEEPVSGCGNSHSCLSASRGN